MDSLTAHYVARELDARWRDRRLSLCLLDRAHRAVVLAAEGEKEAVCIDLAAPEVAIRAVPPEGLGALGGGSLARGWTVHRVHAPTDDRRLVIELVRPGRFRGSPERRAALEVSLVPTARGALLRDAGGRPLASIGTKLPPRAAARPVLDDAVVSSAARAGDVEALLAGRWMSPLVARWLIQEPERAVERYRTLLGEGPARPAWCDGRLVPFPLCPNATPAPSLIGPPVDATPAPEPAAEPGRARAARAKRRMQAELDRAREAPRLRQVADALAALGDAPAPPTVALPNGDQADVEARPGESAIAAAERLYATVRSMQRALEVLPARIEALDAADAGVGSGPTSSRPPRRRGETAARPFRTYRSSGGLPIWVGRGAASNEALTFRTAAPDDVWLHARDAAGAHVVLRWQRPEPPPARDLEEAALLAAWHSKARGSALVPVDWTRRKYVRKPRGAAPGLVIVQRAATVMVRPDADVERKLRDGT